MTDHSHAELAHKGDPSLDRLLFFSDGVFAIAITLLSIEMHPPHGWDGSFAMLVNEGWPMFWSYVLSFIVIGVFWNAHRRLFLNMKRFTGGVFAANLAVLGGVALMPFMTTLLYAGGGRFESFAIYLGLVSLIGLFQGVGYVWAAFVADALRPRQSLPMRVSAALMQTFMPAACCALSLTFFRGAGVGWVLLSAAAVAVLVTIRTWAVRRERAGAQLVQELA